MKTSRKAFFFLTCFFLISGCVFSQTTNTVVKAKIVVEKNESEVKLTGTAENLSDVVQSFSFQLTVIKKNTVTTNQSSNAQEGFFSLDPNENKNLSNTQINLTTGDEVIVLLLFYNENKQVIGKDRVVLTDEKKKTNLNSYQ